MNILRWIRSSSFYPYQDFVVISIVGCSFFIDNLGFSNQVIRHICDDLEVLEQVESALGNLLHRLDPFDSFLTLCYSDSLLCSFPLQYLVLLRCPVFPPSVEFIVSSIISSNFKLLQKFSLQSFNLDLPMDTCFVTIVVEISDLFLIHDVVLETFILQIVEANCSHFYNVQ